MIQLCHGGHAEINVTSFIIFLMIRVIPAQKICKNKKGNDITTCDQCLWQPGCEWCSQLSEGTFLI